MSIKQKLRMRWNTYRQVDYVNQICGNKKLTGYYEGEIIRNVHSIGKRQILRSLPNYAPLFIGGAYCNIQPEVLSTMA